MTTARPLALLSVTVIDGTGSDPHEDMAVIVKGDRISDIIPMTSYHSSDEVEEHPFDGYWVTPGLIDAHVHLAGGRAGIQDQEHGVAMESPLLRAMRSVHQAQELLRYGVTAVRDISWNGLYLKRLFSGGATLGPKVIACGPGLSRTGGHEDLFQFSPSVVHDTPTLSPFAIIADGEGGVVKAVRTLLREGADAIKIFASGGDNWPHDRNSDVHYSLDELRAIVDEAHRQRGTIVAAHAENREAIALAIQAGCDTIEHGEDLDEEIAAHMVAKGTILVPTLELILNWESDFVPAGNEASLRPEPFLYRDHYPAPTTDAVPFGVDRARDSFAIAQAAGVRIALGSDTVFEPLTPYGEYSARELLALASNGLTPMEALESATKVSAAALGMESVLGTLERGKVADLLVLPTSPLEDLNQFLDPTSIELVLSDGVPVASHGRLLR